MTQRAHHNSTGFRATSGALRGFTLVELLTVIAIIAVLAALLLPALAGVQKEMSKGRCSTNLLAVIQAAKMYKEDHQVFPDALLGYNIAAVDAPCISTPSLQNPRLLPYVKDEQAFTCPLSPVKTTDRLTVDVLNPMTNQVHVNNVVAPTWKYCFYPWDSYDFQFLRGQFTDLREERLLHFNKKWTPGSTTVTDDPHQLVYKEPPDNTVVTWCLYHGELSRQTGAPGRGGQALVLFLNGNVKRMDAKKLANWTGTPPNSYPWQVSP